MRAERSTRSTGCLSAWLVAIACGALSGCGFHPVYGGANAAQFDETLASVQVGPISERIGQQVANSLRDTLNPTGERVAKRYTLAVTLYTTTGDLAIRKDGTASRELQSVSASFVLYPFKGGSAVFSGSARSLNSYDIGENPYSVIVANSSASTRAAEEISSEIRNRLITYFQRAAKS